MGNFTFPSVLLAVWFVALVTSGVDALDPFTWVLEVAPAVIGILILAATYRRFRLTNLLYGLILIHSMILMLGGHYTYAEVPLGYWMQDWFGFTRNHYDRIGHLAQGFIPAMVARELVLRHNVLKRGVWLFVLIVLSCLGISAIYELIEWATAVLTGEAADAFLGTQGDVWDSQKDMLMAGIGASIALLMLGGLHDRALRDADSPSVSEQPANEER